MIGYSNTEQLLGDTIQEFHKNHETCIQKDEVLDGLLEGKLNSGEDEKMCREHKAIATALSMMLQEIEMETWEEAEPTLPDFTDEDVVKTFHPSVQ